MLKPKESSDSPLGGVGSIESGDNNDVGTPGSQSHKRLHDLSISDCSDVHLYLLQPFENATISGASNCTIVVGAVAGLLHVVDNEKTKITTAARRILISNSSDTIMSVFTPTPPLLVGDNRCCQFAPYNTYYDGLRMDLLATGLAAAVAEGNQSPFYGPRSSEHEGPWPPLQCASNKWKQPIEISKLEIPQVASVQGSNASPPLSPTSSPGADDIVDSTVQAPILQPASEFHILFVPLETESERQRRIEDEVHDESTDDSPDLATTESKYCRALALALQLSPFPLSIEYERRALLKADRMVSIQQTIRKKLSEEKQVQFEEELNRGFRDWLVTSGNLRQVLDLVHLERRNDFCT